MNELAEPGIADEVEAELEASGFAVRRLDLDRVHLAEAHALASAPTSSPSVAATPSICFPSHAEHLEPLVMTSHLSPPSGMDLSGPALVDVLVLPHDNRAGRRKRHKAAVRVFGSRLALAPLADGDDLVHDHGATSIIRG